MQPTKNRHPRGFTLPELLVSVLMVVLLMLGVNTVFRMSSDTIGVGQTMNRQTRDLRSAAATMADDCKRWAPDSPLFFISNEAVPTRDKDGNHVRDLNGNYLYQRRDTMGFCARGSFRRHTANDGSFISDTTGLEAWVWYGHLVADPLPNDPRIGTVSNVLGRVQVVLKDEATIRNGEDYIVVPKPQDNAGLLPLRNDSRAKYQTGWWLENSRFDLAGTTIDQMREIVRQERGADDQPGDRWWSDAVYRRNSTADTFRYQARTIIPRPISSARMAQVAPVFLTDCEEFRVEFAGDYVTQKDTGDSDDGTVTEAKPDGQIDFMFVEHLTPQNNYVKRRTVRWYGLPRDLNPPQQGREIITPEQDIVPVSMMGNQAGFPYFQREYRYTPSTVPNGLRRHTVVFCDEAPKLVRVAIKLIDPAGRIQDGTWTEYVLGPQ